MEPECVIRVKADWRGVPTLLFCCLCLYVLWWQFQRIDQLSGTRKSAWFDSLPLDLRSFLMAALLVLIVFGILALIAPVIFRIPLLKCDRNGISAYALRRKSILWKDIEDVQIHERQLRIRPKITDPDQRELRFVLVPITGYERIIEAIYPFRGDLVPAPKSVLKRRAAKIALAERAQRLPLRAEPPIKVDARTWTG